MGGEPIEIPLFPLNVVLFPGMALPLHIFEPRYREMTADCLDSQMPIGIVLALPESTLGQEVPASVGTFARIADYERLPDGRYNLLAIGTERFEISAVRRERAYITGVVQPLDEVVDIPASDAMVREARDLLDHYLHVVLEMVGNEDECEIKVPEEPVDLSYLIAMCLACDDGEKQRLLETSSVRERLAKAIALLRQEVDALAEHEQPSNASAEPYGGDRSHLN